MTRVSGTVAIRATPEKVWGVLADFGGVARWAPTVHRSYLTTDATMGIGTVRRCEVPGFGGVEERVVEWNEGSDLSDSVKDVGPIEHTLVRYAVQSAREHSTVNVTADLTMRAGPFWRVLVVGVWPVVRATMQLGLWGLKRHVESARPQLRTESG